MERVSERESDVVERRGRERFYERYIYLRLTIVFFVFGRTNSL